MKAKPSSLLKHMSLINVLLDVASAAAVSVQWNINNAVSTHLTLHNKINYYSKIHNGYDKSYPVEPRE